METTTPFKDTVLFLAAQMDSLTERKPSLKEILNAFRGVMIAGADLRAELASLPAPRVAPPDLARLSAGVPLLYDAEFIEDVPLLTDGVKRMLIAVETAFPPLKQDADTLLSRVEEDANTPAAWLGILIRNEDDPLKGLAEQTGVSPEALRFSLEQAFKPFLQWLADGTAAHVEQMTWDKGYCPICGSYPDTSYLKKGEEEQEFLVAHGGQRWLHCAWCSYEWRLHRIRCPYCDNEETESLEYLAAKETPHEKVYVCHKCKKYLTCLDTSELIEKPPSDLIPFELLHLDIIAQKKGFTPLAWRHWNSMTT
jgi:FdhE protein